MITLPRSTPHSASNPMSHSATARWRALGTGVELAVTQAGLLAEAVDLATALIDRVDRSCSRFRADSDLTRANAAAGTWVAVDRMLLDAVQVAVRAARDTGGLVDPTLGRALAAVGYDRDLDDVRAGRVDPASFRLPSARPRPGAWRDIGLDPGGALKVPPGTALDLGATGKAFAADLVAQELASTLGCGVVASLGGDVAVAGTPPETVDGRGWPVRIEDEDAGQGDAGQRAGEPHVVLLTDGGIATSSIRRRSWRHRGRLVHHLLDPRTGVPVPKVWSEVTVRAASCADANAASTAAMVLGEDAVVWLDRAGLPARLRRAGSGALAGTAGWPGVPPAHSRGARAAC